MSPFGIPVDLLDRMLIISTEALGPEDYAAILRTRAEEEDVELDSRAL